MQIYKKKKKKKWLVQPYRTNGQAETLSSGDGDNPRAAVDFRPAQ